MQIGKKRGAPPGNQNARTHGYYSNTFDAEEETEIKRLCLSGQAADIALLKVKLRSVLLKDPGNKRVLERAILRLAIVVKNFYGVDVKDQEALQVVLGKEFKEVFEPLGMWKGR